MPIAKGVCDGFGSGNFLHSRFLWCYVWICDQNIVDNSYILVVPEQCLHSIKYPSVSHNHAAPPVTRLRMNKKLGGDTDRVAGQNWLK